MAVYQPPTNRVNATMAKLALTSVFAASRRRATYVNYAVFMQLPARDREIIQLVGRFKQLATSHIKALVYPDQLHNPQARSIKRLLDNKLLARVNERLGGMRGGNQMYVYQLGTQGRRLFPSSRSRFSTVVDHHALAIADVYTQLFEAHRAGTIRLLNWATEPDCHIEVGGVYLKPDLYIDVVTRHETSGRRWPRWVEVDLGTEHKRQVLEKISDYTRAYASRDDYPLPRYPTTLLLATRDERASELQYWLRYAKGLPDIFQVGTVDNLLSILHR